jgi:hypothetical protein
MCIIMIRASRRGQFAPGPQLKEAPKFAKAATNGVIINNYWMRLSRISRII